MVFKSLITFTCCYLAINEGGKLFDTTRIQDLFKFYSLK